MRGNPVSVNRLYAQYGGKKFLTKEGREIKEYYGWQVRQQYRGEPIDGDVDVDLTFFFKTKRRRDGDNVVKVVFDALSKVVINDDDQITDHHVHKRHDAENPRVEIVLSTVERDTGDKRDAKMKRPNKKVHA